MENRKTFIAAGILLGLGFGGFFDGIVLHQVLQWHHMLTSAGYPGTTVAGLTVNTLADGLFHLGTYLFSIAGVLLLWLAGPPRPGRRLAGTVLVGFGVFNLAEGVVNHHLLGLHHVNETAPPQQWLYWDLAFLAWGAAMLAGGAWLAFGTPRRFRAFDR